MFEETLKLRLFGWHDVDGVGADYNITRKWQ
jgi:hypothetical protein